MQEAAQTGGQIAIPAGEYTAHLARSEFAGQLVDHIKTEPDAWSKAEAREWMQSGEGSALQREMDYLLREKQADETFRASSDAVRDTIKNQLAATGRFSTQAHDSYAALTSSFYAVQAAKMGVTPEELYRQYPLRVMAGDVAQNGYAQDTGPFGPILTEFKGDAQGAIARLMEMKEGEAIAALHHPEIGDIDLVWGEEGTGASDGYGLAKLVKYHPEVLDDLQGILQTMVVKQPRSKNRVHLESADHKAAVRLTWDDQAKHWLLTAFRKEERGAAGTTTDTASMDGEGDTARLSDASDSIVEQKLARFYQTAAETAFRAPEVRNEQGQLLAPNGEPSKLNEHQWHQVRSPQFKAWFGDWENDPKNASKVVDENGEPLVVYHGTNADFSSFDRAKASAGKFGKGFYFTQHKRQAETYAYANAQGDSNRFLVEAFVNARNPFETKSVFSFRAQMASEGVDSASSSEHLLDKGHDGVVSMGKEGVFNELVAFHPNQIKSATGNSGAFDGGNPDILYQRTQQTKATYEARIDALFAGDKPRDVRRGEDAAIVLDRSDILDLLKISDGPVYLDEAAVGKPKKGQPRGTSPKHPNMTADAWKKVPQWLDNPAAVFDSATVNGALVLLAPELVDGSVVLMSIEPKTQGADRGVTISLLTNAYDKDGGPPPVNQWLREGKAWYIDKKVFPDVMRRGGLQSPATAQNKPGMRKILTEKNLAGYRKARGDVLFARQQQQPTVTRGFFDPASNTIGLLKDADLSTFLHEAGHFFLEMQVDLASRVQQ